MPPSVRIVSSIVSLNRLMGRITRIANVGQQMISLGSSNERNYSVASVSSPSTSSPSAFESPEDEITTDSIVIDESAFGGDRRLMVSREIEAFKRIHPYLSEYQLTERDLNGMISIPCRQRRLHFCYACLRCAYNAEVNHLMNRRRKRVQIPAGTGLDGMEFKGTVQRRTIFFPDQDRRKWSRIKELQTVTGRTPIEVCVDLSFLRYQDPCQRVKVIRQLRLIRSINHDFHPYPGRLHFTNVSVIEDFCRMFDDISHKTFLNTFHPECFTDLFPPPTAGLSNVSSSHSSVNNKEVVMLSPDARDTLLTVDPEREVYVLGAIVDVGPFDNERYGTEARARQLGIRSAKLPIDRYHHWINGTKNMPLSGVHATLLDVASGVPWSVALRQNVPNQKLIPKAERAPDPRPGFSSIRRREGIAQSQREERAVRKTLFEEAAKFSSQQH